ncbi:MAG: glycosyltransferase family 1 protein [Treponema sp.]
MKIGINTFGCDHGRSGIGAYILSLVHNLPKTEHKIQLFGHELDKYTYTSGVEGIQFAGVSISDTLFAEKTWHNLFFNNFARKQKYDIALFPSGTKVLPIRLETPAVLVMQNILNDSSAGGFGSITGLMSKFMLKPVKGIISPSRYIKTNLLNCGIAEEKIKVIHNGIDTKLFYPRNLQKEDALMIKPFAIRRPYIMYASRIIHPEKRHIELIEAFGIFKQKTKAPHRLVIAGADGERSEQVHQAVLRSPVASDILLTGYFPHENLPLLYSAADLCVFPSSVEGVGLPVIEAMACGIPTACAQAGALPEIAGSCTSYFDQNNPEEMAAVISGLINDAAGENSGRRQTLIDEGIEWVKQYSWKKTAEETLDYLEEAGKM